MKRAFYLRNISKHEHIYASSIRPLKNELLRMKTLILLICTSIFVTQTMVAQRYVSKNTKMNIYSYTPLETIDATNSQAVSIMDLTTGDIQFSLLIKSFEFKRELMEEHFNENYMESDIYPKAGFKGKLSGLENVNLKKDGSYLVDVSGDLTIHGVTKAFSTAATLEVKKGTITGKSSFVILPEDYNIAIPDLVKDKIAKEITVTIEAPYQEN